MNDKEVKVRKKKKLGSYPSVSVVFSITLSLFVIGLFGLLLIHTNKLTKIVQDNIEVQVFLSKEISQNQKIQVLKTLSAKDFVTKLQDEAQISFISKEAAEKKFIEDTGEDFKDFLGENPLRDAYVVKIDPKFQSSENLQAIKNETEKLTGVYEVVYIDNLVDSINKNLTKISLVLLGFATILLLVVIVLINNTIKLALFSQRFLIRSMQLVGAKSGFIRKPFLARSFFYGILSGLLASGALYGLLNFANSKIEDLSSLQDPNKVFILFILLLIIGGFIGFLSTYRAISKYLKMSLDDLY